MPIELNKLVDRVACAAALREQGFPVSSKTLATMVTRGGGPPFVKFGRRPLYRLGEALTWAENRLTAPRTTSSEGDLSASRARV